MPLVRKPTAPSQSPAAEDSGVLAALASANADERWAAARAAPSAKVQAAALATALRKETEPRVREALFTSLARIGTTESAHELLALLRSDNANLRTGALDALRMMVDEVRELLPKLLSDRDADIRILSCELTRGLPGEEATALLCTVLAGEQEANVCAAAIEVLTEVGTPEALPALVECERRFRGSPFLAFAIQVATDRINASSTPPRG
jgi:HEAT repeat protein